MVYDASASGLNTCLWAPRFILPSAESLIECMTQSSWMGVLDMGEQLVNLHYMKTSSAFVDSM
jgi:hypothetical protein